VQIDIEPKTNQQHISQQTSILIILYFNIFYIYISIYIYLYIQIYKYKK